VVSSGLIPPRQNPLDLFFASFIITDLLLRSCKFILIRTSMFCCHEFVQIAHPIHLLDQDCQQPLVAWISLVQIPLIRGTPFLNNGPQRIFGNRL